MPNCTQFFFQVVQGEHAHKNGGNGEEFGDPTAFEYIQYLVKICDHLGRLLAGVGISTIKASYVSE